MNYKRTKFGELTGDVSREAKIKMLEKKQEFFVWPWQLITLTTIKSFRKEYRKKANRRFRKDKSFIEE